MESTYADNRSCAVAHEICARHRYLGENVEKAVHSVVMEELKEAGGEGGVITIDRYGHVQLQFISFF